MSSNIRNDAPPSYQQSQARTPTSGWYGQRSQARNQTMDAIPLEPWPRNHPLSFRSQRSGVDGLTEPLPTYGASARASATDLETDDLEHAPLGAYAAPIAGAAIGAEQPHQGWAQLPARGTPRRRRPKPWEIAGVVGFVMVVGVLMGVMIKFPFGSNSSSNNNNNNNKLLGASVTGSRNGSALLANPNVQAFSLTGCSIAGYSAAYPVSGKDFQLKLGSTIARTAIASTLCNDCDVTPKFDVAGGLNLETNEQAEYGDGARSNGTLYAAFVGAPGSDNLDALNITAISSQGGLFWPTTCNVNEQNATPIQGVVGNDLVDVLSATTGEPAVLAFSGCDVGGKASYGSYDPSTVTQPPLFVPRARNNTNSVKITSLSLGQLPLVNSTAGLGIALVDTAAPLFTVPGQVFAKFANALENDQAFTSAFSTPPTSALVTTEETRAKLDADLPPLVIGLDDGAGGQLTLTLPPTSGYLVPFATNPGDVTAVGGYMFGISADNGIDANNSISVLGAAVLRGLTVVFDSDNQQIGFPPQAACNGTLIDEPA